MFENDKFYSVTQIAAATGIKRAKIWRLVRAGKIPSKNFGEKARKYYKTQGCDITAYLESNITKNA